MTDPTTVEACLATALDAYADLEALGEEIEDEWTYVTELAGAWRDRLGTVAAARGDEAVNPAARAAVEAASDLVASIEDPHRAIDWLSTFPQVVLVALEEPT